MSFLSLELPTGSTEDGEYSGEGSDESEDDGDDSPLEVGGVVFERLEAYTSRDFEDTALIDAYYDAIEKYQAYHSLERGPLPPKAQRASTKQAAAAKAALTAPARPTGSGVTPTRGPGDRTPASSSRPAAGATPPIAPARPPSESSNRPRTSARRSAAPPHPADSYAPYAGPPPQHPHPHLPPPSQHPGYYPPPMYDPYGYLYPPPMPYGPPPPWPAPTYWPGYDPYGPPPPPAFFQDPYGGSPHPGPAEPSAPLFTPVASVRMGSAERRTARGASAATGTGRDASPDMYRTYSVGAEIDAVQVRAPSPGGDEEEEGAGPGPAADGVDTARGTAGDAEGPGPEFIPEAAAAAAAEALGDSDLAEVLMSWYRSGYQTGYYVGKSRGQRGHY